MTKSKKKNYRKEWVCGYAMIAPLTLGLCVFYLWPIVKVFWDSFHNVGAFNKRSWAGLDNYVKMFQDPIMWQALGNTCKYVIIIVPIMIGLALLLASLLNTKIKGRSFFRVIYFIPAITMGAAVAMMWNWMYNGDYGIINAMLEAVGIERQLFLTNPKVALYCICIVSIWSSVGYNMIILLAGIQGISKSYYEAASIDGANGIQKFVNITLPLVTPTLFFVMITSLISTFQMFDAIYMLVPKTGLAMESTQSMVIYFYRNAFDYSKKGYASALAVFLFLIIMVITAFQMKVQDKWVNYD